MFLWTGPGLHRGVTFRDWLALLRENHFAVDPPCWWRAAVITFLSAGNSFGRWWEQRLYRNQLENVAVEPPVFLLGIWRSGTTHLQNLFARDPRFAFPNWFQVTYPHQFLHTEAWKSRLEAFFVPRTRLQDNVRFGYDQPSEEDIALCTLTGLSPLLSWVFPRRAEHYDRYLTFRDVPDGEVSRWKEAFRAFVRKLMLKYQRPLVLKSPGHTARIRLLLELFPDARFVHICRNPYAVYQSAGHANRELMRYVALQRPSLDVDERTIRQYAELYDAYFEDRELIPGGRLHELRFEDLEQDPIGQMRKVYAALDLPDFAEVEPALRGYVDSLSGYRKNAYPELSPDLKARLAREWKRYFRAWDYAT